MKMPKRQSPARRLKLSFGLRTLLTFILVCAAAAAGWAQFIAPRLSAEKQRRLHARLAERGIVLGARSYNQRRRQLTSDDVAILSEVPDLAAIKWSGCDDETLRQLSRLKQLQLLDLEFDMAGSDFTAEGLQYLTKLPDLRALKLYTYMLSNKELSRLGQLSELEILSLMIHSKDTMLEEGDVDWTRLQKLHTLDLHGARLNENGLRQLSQLPQLKSLTFKYCKGFTADGLRHIGELNQLKELNFLNCQDLTDEGLRHLGGLKNLESLSLVCDPGWDRTDEKYDETGRVVSSSRVTVGASQHYYSDAGLRRLGGLSKLKNLCVYSPRLTDEVFITARKLSNLSLLCLGLCPPNGMAPGAEMARWLNMVYPWKPEERPRALEELRKNVKGEVFRADSFGRRADAYSLPWVLNKQTFDNFEFWRDGGK